MKDKFLPIGSVVTLKGATKRIMIVGYCPINDEKVMYDYSACPFPEGVSTPDNLFAFNHDQIEVINNMGISDDDYVKFNDMLKKFIDGVESMKDIKFKSDK